MESGAIYVFQCRIGILRRSKDLADAAGLYRAGSRSGPGYQQRFNDYTREAERDRAQLKCVAGMR